MTPRPEPEPATRGQPGEPAGGLEPDGAEPSISMDELASFTRQLGAMLDADVNVLRALRIASQYSGNQHLVEEAREIARRLEDGREFHQALAPRSDLFDPFFLEMARQGETDGQLGKALVAVADYLDHISRPAAAPGLVAAPLPSSPAAGPAGPGSAGATLLTLGTLAVGSGGIWAAAAAGLLPDPWVGPLALAWSGACLLAGGFHLQRNALASAASVPPPAAALPPKTLARKAAETEGVVRGALQEEEEELEQRAAASVGQSPGSASGPSVDTAPNGRAFEPDPELLKPDPELPRFQF